MSVYRIDKTLYRQLHQSTWPDVPFEQFEGEMDVLLDALNKMGLRVEARKVWWCEVDHEVYDIDYYKELGLEPEACLKNPFLHDPISKDVDGHNAEHARCGWRLLGVTDE